MWPEDPKLRSAAFELYGAVWEHLPPGIEQARAWGGDWFQVSTPFLVRSGDGLLAHAGVIECDLTVAGKRREIAAIHGVCVHPDHRGQGLGREVLEAALKHIDGTSATTTILWSEKVDLYRKFGFEPCVESVFTAPVPTALSPVARPTPAMRLDLDKAESRNRLLEALRRRQPVSGIIAAADSGWHFLIDLALWTESKDFLIDLPEHDAVMVAEVEGSLLRLYDVLGPRLPPVADLVGAAQSVSGATVERLEIYFSPDRLDLDTQAMPHPFEDVLMIRGARLPDEDTPFALSPFTRT